MSHVRLLLLCTVLSAVGCATSGKRAADDAQAQQALSERIERICALAEPERSAELEKLKSETGFVLYCGR